MFHIILYQPEIPPNTGNIIRLCANTGAQLHLIKPLGFELEDKQLRRAGLDYHEWAQVKIYEDLAEFQQRINPTRVFACSTRGSALYSEHHYQANDAFLFGPETRGLPKELIDAQDPQHLIRIPMLANSRSLNLSNSAAIILYEALRQQGFSDGVQALR